MNIRTLEELVALVYTLKVRECPIASFNTVKDKIYHKFKIR